MDTGSTAQKPERLYRERGLIVLVGLLAAVFIATTFVNVPQLALFTTQRYIEIQ